jgi:hypothetical protein
MENSKEVQCTLEEFLRPYEEMYKELKRKYRQLPTTRFSKGNGKNKPHRALKTMIHRTYYFIVIKF